MASVKSYLYLYHRWLDDKSQAGPGGHEDGEAVYMNKHFSLFLALVVSTAKRFGYVGKSFSGNTQLDSMRDFLENKKRKKYKRR